MSDGCDIWQEGGCFVSDIVRVSDSLREGLLYCGYGDGWSSFVFPPVLDRLYRLLVISRRATSLGFLCSPHKGRMMTVDIGTGASEVPYHWGALWILLHLIPNCSK